MEPECCVSLAQNIHILAGHSVKQIARLLGLSLHTIARNSGQCLDVQNQNAVPGALIQQYPCWGGQNQQWAPDPQ
jgi:Ricin-type beta-trefoil lectin domain-like